MKFAACTPDARWNAAKKKKKTHWIAAIVADTNNFLCQERPAPSALGAGTGGSWCRPSVGTSTKPTPNLWASIKLCSVGWGWAPPSSSSIVHSNEHCGQFSIEKTPAKTTSQMLTTLPTTCSTISMLADMISEHIPELRMLGMCMLPDMLSMHTST